MPNFVELHKELSERFYTAYRNGLITEELQDIFDRVHKLNWLQKSLSEADPTADLTDIEDEIKQLDVTVGEISTLKSVIGDWETE